jgi:sugar phosphate isomerase/epimerase
VTLRVYQSLWATEKRRAGVPELPIAERFDSVKEAGYDGMAIDLGALDLASARKDLIFLCELGPPNYALTDSNGDELSDRWQEALELKRLAQALWTETGPSPPTSLSGRTSQDWPMWRTVWSLPGSL